CPADDSLLAGPGGALFPQHPFANFASAFESPPRLDPQTVRLSEEPVLPADWPGTAPCYSVTGQQSCCPQVFRLSASARSSRNCPAGLPRPEPPECRAPRHSPTRC